MTDRRERPAFFSALDIQAIIAGHKTEFRTPVNPQPVQVTQYPDTLLGWMWRTVDTWMIPPERMIAACPHGQIGDRLWVKEAWTEIIHGREAFYRADKGDYYSAIDWSPSTRMPRWAARLVLEITDVQVERLHCIDYAGLIAEGVRKLPDYGEAENDYERGMFRAEYSARWQKRYRRTAPWQCNPFVWVVQFRVL
jgi:hypothetical protein